MVNKITNGLSERIDSEISIGKVYFSFFNELTLEDVLLEDQQSDTLFYVSKITAKIDSLRRKEQKLALNNVNFENSRLNVKKLENENFNFQFLIDSLRNPEKTPDQWNIRVKQLDFNNSNILYTDAAQAQSENYFLNELSFAVSGLEIDEQFVDFQIDELSLNDGDNLQINNLNGNFYYFGDSLIANNLNLETNYSAISNSSLIFQFPEGNESIDQLNLDFTFQHAVLNFQDLALLFPELYGMNQVIDLSGNVYGTVNDLNGRNIILRTGQNTLAEFDFYVNDISSPEAMFLFLDLKSSQTTFNDISSVKLPYSAENEYLVFPESFYDAGLLRYRGNFTGFFTDFVAFGTLTSEMGTLTTDVSLVPGGGGNFSYQGEIATENFKLGELFNSDELGTITFNGSADGRFDQASNSIYGEYRGKIAQFEVNGYNYESMQIDGRIDNKRFDGVFSINDPNLKFDFIGQVNLNPEVPVFDFQMNVLSAYPARLNLSQNFPQAEASFLMLANFSGNNIDNLEGTINVQNGTYTNRNGSLNLDGMELRSVAAEGKNTLTFISDFFDFKAEGIYHFATLKDAFKKSFNRYVPAIDYEVFAQAENNNFEYQFEAKNLDSLTAVFIPGYQFETPVLLYGKLNSANSVFELEGSISAFSTENVIAKNIFIGNGPTDGIYESKFRFGELMLKNGMTLNNLSVDSKIIANTIQNQITWSNEDELNYSGQIVTEAVFEQSASLTKPRIQIEGSPTEIYVADSLWQIDPFSVTIDSTAIDINNFRLHSDRQAITLNGKISEDADSKLTADFRNINLWNFDEYLDRELAIGGTMNGSAGIADFYNGKFIFSDITIEDFVYQDQIIGRVSLSNEWNFFESIVDSEIEIQKNDRESLVASGSYNPAEGTLNYDISTDRLSLVFLDPLLNKTFSGIHGNASGKLNISGTPQQLLFNGVLLGENAGLTVDYTQVQYNFTDSVYFKGDTIHFDRINIEDQRGNTGVFDGTIVHRNFKDLQYDLSVQSNRILAYNAPAQINEQFFGRIIASGSFNIDGRARRVYLSGTGTTLNGTSINISLESEGDIEEYDFIRFVSFEEAEQEEIQFVTQNDKDFNLNLNINATPDAEVQLIYNSQIGDVIRARGEGFLNIEMNNQGDISLVGDYTVEKGDYLFTLQNVINKRFEIEQGGTIIWAGDPYEAIIEINALYNLKASVYDMLEASFSEVSANSRIPVECRIMLTENLMNPAIEFEINFPTVDTYITSSLQQYFNTPEEMNRQILSLLVLGKFYIPEYMRGNYQAQNTNVIGTTASELFSNQLSNWLSQINNNVDVGFNYRPGNQITDDEIELALSTQIFNDRVEITGNIGNNVNPYTGNNSQLVGDFEVNVKLVPSGKLRLKAYNRSNNNLIYETSPYTQGVGFSFTEEYNTIGDLWRKMNAIFRKNDDNEQ